MSGKFFGSAFLPQTISFFKEKYSFRIFGSDLLAGFTIGAFSFPLAIAFAIASGVDPIRGLYTAIIAGIIISLLGGSKVQIAGPTGTMAILIINIVQKHGYDGLFIASMIAAVLLIIFGLTRIGTLIKYIPDTITVGYSTAIALTIFSSQLIDLFGLPRESLSTDVFSKWVFFARHVGETQLLNLLVGVLSLAFLIFMRKKYPRFPATIIAIILGAAAIYLTAMNVPTIGSSFGDLSREFTIPALPSFSWAKADAVFHDAVMMALLISIESIVSTVVSDGMIRTKTRYDCELVAQGLSNLSSAMLGGIPASGSLSRTVASVRMGARTPVAGIMNAVFVGIITWSFLPFLEFIPMATIAAVLCMLAWSMFDYRRFFQFFLAPRIDLLVMMITFCLIIFTDLMVGVEIGIVLSTSLFIKRMSEHEIAIRLSRVFRTSEKMSEPVSGGKPIPKQVQVYEINGPFFFGIIERLQDIINTMDPPPKIFILRMRKVPFIDATAMRAIHELHDTCSKQNTILFLSGVFGQTEKDLRRIGIEKKIGKQNIFPDIDSAIQRTRQILNEGTSPQEPLSVKNSEPTVIFDSSAKTLEDNINNT